MKKMNAKTLEQQLCDIQPPAGMTFGCPEDWTYMDTPRTTHKAWNEFVDILEELGKENYKMLSFAQYPIKGVLPNSDGMISPEQCSYRGQFMFSPYAIKKFKEILNAKKI